MRGSLIEGVGGLMVPLGERFMVSDLIAGLRCSVVLAARNGIGVINHVLLSTSVLSKLGHRRVAVVLMGKSHPDISAHNNSEVLRELLPGIDLLEVPFIRGDLRSAEAIRAQAKRGCKELLIRLAQTRALPRVVPRIEE
jgi:dethiobiotin synthetase